MTSTDPAARLRLAFGICVRPLAGETESGDGAAGISWSRGVILTLVDGLGHGPRAAAAANAFLACIREDCELPLDAMFARAHTALLKTRGAVAALARLDEETQTGEFAGIGNVTTLLAPSDGRRPAHLVTIAGVLGSAYRTVRPQVFAFQMNDVVMMHSDGIRPHFDAKLLRATPLQSAVEAIVTSHAKGTDDAACAMLRAFPAAGVTPRAPDRPSALPAGERIVPLRVGGDAACAALEARTFAQTAGFGAREQWEISLAVSELATNVLKFAGEGEIRLRIEHEPHESIVVEALDRGRGIPDVSAATADGYSEGALLAPDRARSEGRGLGVGLGTVHRMMDHVEIDGDASRGTRIVARKRRVRLQKA